MDGLTYDEARGDADTEAFVGIMREAFTWPEDASRGFVTMMGGVNRVARLGDDVVGALQLIPMGQFWGGRRVEHWGVAGVVVSSEARNRGVGSFLMREAVGEMEGRGVELSG